MENAELKTYSQMRHDFMNKFHKTLKPYLATFEKERKQRLFWANFSNIACAIFTIVFIALMVRGSSYMSMYCGDVIFSVFFSIIFSLFCVSSFLKKRFEFKVKKEIMPVVCSCFENLSWFPADFHNKHFYSDMNLIPQHDYSVDDDAFVGSRLGVNFNIAETKCIRETRDSRGRRYKMIVFSGVIIKLDMNKSFKCKTIIETSEIIKSIYKNLRRTSMEDTVFNKKFDVYTNDEVEARYLITTTFIERIKNIKTSFKAQHMRVIFYEGNLYIALSVKKDLFSLCTLNKPVCDDSQFFQMYDEIVSIIKLVDHFKLNQKIGL